MQKRVKSIESEELKLAINEYKAAIKKAKSFQSLNNYHKKFLENLKERVHKCTEKKYAKIYKLTQPNLFTIETFQIFPLLYENRLHELSYNIPSTLYKDDSYNFLLETDRKLVFTTGNEINQCFLKSLPILSNKPICVFKSFDGKTVLFDDIASIQNFMNENSKTNGIYQHFLMPKGNTVSILLSHATKNSFNKYFILKNTIEIPKLKKHKLGTNNSIINIAKSVKIFPKYNKRVICELKRPNGKRFLSFELPEIEPKEKIIKENSPKEKKFSSLIERIQYKETNANSPKNSCCLTPKDKLDCYLVNTRNPNLANPYQIKVPIPELEKMTKSIYFLVTSHIRKKLHKNIEEITLMFIKNNKED